MNAHNPGDSICDHCGHEYFWDERRTCWKCNRPACPMCMNEPGDVCPECSQADIPRKLEPMLAIQRDVPPEGDWGIEFKWDGVRALTYLDGKQLKMESRLGSNITVRYPEAHPLGLMMDGRTAVFDGEIITLDSEGHPDFHRLQQRMHLGIEQVRMVAQRVPVQYYLFDLLFLDGEDLSGRPYVERRGMLESLSIEDNHIKTPPYRTGSAASMIKVARMHGLEGIVCKRLDSTYQPGRRSGDWVKVKIVHQDEFVVGGWTRERSNPERVGALLIGYHEPDRAGLVYAGKVGSGFSQDDHNILTSRLKRLKSMANPFDPPVKDKSAEFVTPRLVVEVSYQRWIPEGLLQIAVYKGLRPDIAASEVQYQR